MGVECGGHTQRCLGKHHVRVVTILCHSGTHILEVLGGVGRGSLDLAVHHGTHLLVHLNGLTHKRRAALLGLLLGIVQLLVEAVHGIVELFASLQRIGLDLRGIGGDVLLSVGELGLGLLIESGQGTLLVEHSLVESVLLGGLVLLHDLASLLGASNGLLVTLVLKLGNLREVLGCECHLGVEGILRDLCVLCHLLEEHSLHLVTSLGIVRTVLGHLDAESRDILLASSSLSRDLFLHLLEVIQKEVAAVGGVIGQDSSDLLDIHALHRDLVTGGGGLGDVRRSQAFHGLQISIGCHFGVLIHVHDIGVLRRQILRKNSLVLAISSDVHHCAAEGQAAYKGERNALALTFRLCRMISHGGTSPTQSPPC